MRQIWLRPNRRALSFAMVLPILLLVLGLLPLWLTQLFVLQVLGGLLAVLALLVLLVLAALLVTPRLAYEQGHLLVYLNGVFPERVPIELVECFFLGSSASYLRGAQLKDESKATAIVVRLAERATAFHQRPVQPVLGQWCDGYIIIRGTWSEPITRDVMQQLNTQLMQAQQQRKQQEQESRA